MPRPSSLALLQERMAAQDVALVVIGLTANLRFLTGWRPQHTTRLTALLVTPTQAVMIMPDFDAVEFAAAPARPPVAPWRDDEGPAAGVRRAQELLGPIPPVGSVLVDDELPFAFLTQLQPCFGARTPRRATAIVEGLRRVKRPEEVDVMTRAGALVSRGIDTAIACATPGMTERELQREIERTLSDGGAESLDYVLVQAGAHSAIPHHDGDDTCLRKGEPVLVDIAIRVDGWFADITQQVFLGEPSSDYVHAYETVARAQEAGVRQARAGSTAHAVAAAASEVIAAAGLGEFNGPRTGHGIGLDMHEAPSVIEGNHAPLAPGVVITIEPGVYLPGRWGVRIEDTVVVTRGEPRRITRGARPLAVKRDV